MDLLALEQAIDTAVLQTSQDLGAFERTFLSKRGALSAYYAQLKGLAPDARASLGKALQMLREKAQARYDEAKARLTTQIRLTTQLADPTFPAEAWQAGARHPLSLVEEEILELLAAIGFSLAEGPEIEDDWHNFSALNFEPDHPARDMQDTFFLDQDKLLRTHTSTVQVRVMSTQKPPIRILAPGRVYRRETISARAHVYFHQIEGLYIDEGISVADLRSTLTYFAKAFFGEGIKLRWRASYFPFTEISAELDISCLLCEGAGCPVCKQTGWVEVLGCGMVHPNVLAACQIDPARYTGFAFGMGVERLAQLKYNIPDLRLFGQNYYQFLANFYGYGQP